MNLMWKLPSLNETFTLGDEVFKCILSTERSGAHIVIYEASDCVKNHTNYHCSITKRTMSRDWREDGWHSSIEKAQQFLDETINDKDWCANHYIECDSEPLKIK